MQADIDQSGRIEETHRPTVIALANGVSYSVRMPAREKRRLLAELKRLRPQRSATRHHVLVFSTLVFYVIREYADVLQGVIIDQEYTGYEASIKEHILNLCYRYDIRLRCEIMFQRVGKKSPSHDLAIRVYRGKVKADRTITSQEVLREFK